MNFETLTDNSSMPLDHLTIVITLMDGGGTERFAATVANTLKRQGRGVTMCSLHRSPEGGGKRWLDSAVEFRELRVPARFAGPALRRVCGEHPDQPVLALGPEIALVLVGLKALGLISNPVAYRESTAMWRHNSLGWRFLHRRLLSRVDGVIAQTRHGLREAERCARIRGVSVVLPNPCAVLEVEKCDEAGESPSFPQLLVLGRLEPMKGQARVVRAMPGVQERFPGARLHLVGTGSCEASLRETCRELNLEDVVAFHGFVPDPASWYREADLLILPSDYEGLPNVLLEAVAHGCRVLTSGGDGGILETMQALGLSSFVLSLDSFERLLPESIAGVLDAGPEVWEEAQARLKRLASPGAVADHLWAFMMSLKETR